MGKALHFKRLAFFLEKKDKMINHFATIRKTLDLLYLMSQLQAFPIS
jgi:hypothetical protein